ncbi:SurA N-terminal domain-containing protein [Roseomonas sp. OT10]|uniref:peptidylprolyl isomerase n=1 Tax=Roseomonas cutis TaxID=2897332 RepID=UPI001E292BD4|nr:peptidylprolyl isomerase [Roseomonas sp. OT10]UFN50811.1 SurA N-terminal domain-containing protein [Roseomonas sp. OT10]
MLSAFRRLAGTWFAKVLFLLLILSFGIWGIEDIVRNFGRETAVARVDGEPIELTEAQDAARRELQRLQRQLGPRFEANETMRLAVARQAVEALVAQRSLQQEARRMRVAASAEAVRDYVFGIPAFQTAGQFDRRLFNQFLAGNGISEQGFLALVAAELQRQQLTGAVRAGAAGPEAMVKPLVAFVREKRVADIVRLRADDAPEPAAPTEEQLRRYQENEAARFSTPEYRTAVVARLAAEVVAPEVQVSDADIAQAYEANRGRYELPERRALEQAVVPQEEAAKALAEAWRGGADFAAIQSQATAAGGQAVDLGTPSRADLSVPELAEAAFSAPAGGVAGPVQSPFGWHVLKVERIEPPQTRTLDQVRDEIRQELAQVAAADLAFERVNAAEDALAGGAPLEEAARQFGLAVGTVTTDAQGRGPDGNPAAMPVPDYARTEAVQAIFAARQGETPRMTESQAGAGFVGVQLQSVAAPALRPFAEVEPEVRLAWIRDARARSQEERAAALLAATRDGASLAEAAEKAGLSADRTAPFGRDPRQDPAGAATLPSELIRPLFEAKPREVTMARTADGFAVGQVVEVVRDAAADPEALRAARTQVELAMQEELEAQYAAALRDRARATINEDALRQIAGAP